VSLTANVKTKGNRYQELVQASQLKAALYFTLSIHEDETNTIW